MLKKTYSLLLFPLCCILLMLSELGCQNKDSDKNNSTLDSLQVINYSNLGDSISAAAQQDLMGQLMAALKSKGPEYAVNFCSKRAIPITDSLSKKYECEIRRVAWRNRNPDNSLTEKDKVVYDEFAQALTEGNPLQSKLVQQQKAILFYKPIVLGMPACLQCHGKSEELNPMAYAAIQARYPEDKAIDFSMGDLRGMWKITFSTKH